MHPLFTVTAGLVVGVMGVRLAKSANARKALQSTAARGGETVRTGLNQARTGVRDAAVSDGSRLITSVGRVWATSGSLCRCAGLGCRVRCSAGR
jgi:hypothetical protein